MAVFKRKDGKSPYYLFDFYFRGQRYQGSTRFVNKAAAKRFEANLIDRLAKTRAGIVDVEPPPFFLFFAAQFLETVKNALRPSSVRGYRTSLETLAPFHKKRLDEISATEIEEFRRKRLEAGRSRPTVNRDLAFLRLTLAAAVRQDLLPTTPFMQRKVKFLKEHGRERILNFEEERKYLAAATQPLRDVATLILEMGLRPGEVFSIRCEDVHFHAAPPFVHIPFGKTENAVRDIALTERAGEVLSRRVAAAEKKNGQYVFPLRVGNGYDWTRPMNEIEPAHLAALRASKIKPPFRPYDLRHTYGTRASEGGTDSLSLMRLMGHADLKTTLRYVHLSKRHLAEAQKRIEKYRAEREIAEAEAAQKGSAAVQ